MIIGLGNPGDKYKNTRHNAGFITVEKIAAETGIAFRKPFFRKYLIAEGVYRNTDIILVKPLNYMNRSGTVIADLMSKYNVAAENIILICDNMDLYPGVIRLKQRGGDAGHNGIKSVISCIGTSEFKRIYIGIGRPKNSSSIVEHVLGVPDQNDLEKIYRAAETAAENILKLTVNPAEKVMNEINRIKNTQDNICC